MYAILATSARLSQRLGRAEFSLELGNFDFYLLSVFFVFTACFVDGLLCGITKLAYRLTDGSAQLRQLCGPEDDEYKDQEYNESWNSNLRQNVVLLFGI